MRKLIYLFAALLLLSACGEVEEALQGRDHSWDPTPLGEPWAEEFKAALEWWGGRFSFDPTSPNKVTWNLAVGVQLVGLYTPGPPARIYFNPNAILHLGQMCYAARHELGHDWGLGDDLSDPNWIMYPSLGWC